MLTSLSRHHPSQPTRSTGCKACSNSAALPFPFTLAFQPILHTGSGEVFAHEALVRGPNGESAATVLSQVTEDNRYSFDQSCRVKAIEMARALSPSGQPSRVSINFMPGAVYEPAACIRRTLDAASRVGMPLENIIFEVVEGERVIDREHLKSIFAEYRKHGLRTAIDDFGAGYAQLTLLADFQPDLLKLDMDLVRNIDTRPAARRLVRAIAEAAKDLGTQVIGEGVETVAEWQTLTSLGIELFQGYLFAKPAFERFATPTSMPLFS